MTTDSLADSHWDGEESIINKIHRNATCSERFYVSHPFGATDKTSLGCCVGVASGQQNMISSFFQEMAALM